MRRLAHTKYTVFLIAAFAFSSAQSATEPLNSIEVGRNYLDALYAFDFSELEKLLHVDADYHVLSEFSTGEFVVFYAEYSTVIEGEALGMPEQVFSVKMPAVTILRIQNGLVIHHTDHVDYDLMHEQIAKQSKEQAAAEPR